MDPERELSATESSAELTVVMQRVKARIREIEAQPVRTEAGRAARQAAILDLAKDLH